MARRPVACFELFCRWQRSHSNTRAAAETACNGFISSDFSKRTSQKRARCRHGMLSSIPMQLVCAFAALAQIVMSTPQSGPFLVTFENSNDSRTSSTDDKMFKISKHFENAMDCLRTSQDGKMYVHLHCRPKTYDAVAGYIETQRIGADISGNDIIDILCLADFLCLTDMSIKEALCTELAIRTPENAVDNKSFRNEVQKCRSVPIFRIYMLQLLRKHLRGAHKVDVLVGHDGEAKLIHSHKLARNSFNEINNYGKPDYIGTIRKLVISAGECIQGSLPWFLTSLNVCEIEMCLQLKKATVESIGEVESLTRLKMSGCWPEQGSLVGLSKLSRLKELDINALASEWNVYSADPNPKYKLAKEEITAIGAISSLERLDIRFCEIEKDGLSCLQTSGSLRELCVSFDKLTAEDIASLGKIQGLQMLEMSDYRVAPDAADTGMQSLSNITELTAHNQAYWSEHDSIEIAKMENLRRLEIMSWEGMPPESLDHLRKLDNLCVLVISYSGSMHLDEKHGVGIGKIKSLQRLEIRSDIYSSFFVHLPELEELVVSSRNSRLTKKTALGIGQSKSLRQLKIDFHSVQPGCVADSLQELKILTGFELRVSMPHNDGPSKDDVEAIAQIESLETLCIAMCGIEPGWLGSLRKLKSLRKLNVSLNKLSKEDMQGIGEIESLEDLNIGNCEVPGGLVHLKGLNRLRKLCVSTDDLIREDYEAIGRMESLEALRIEGRSWSEGKTQGCLAYLKGLKRLRDLDIPFNILTEEDMRGIAKIENLEKLNMYCTIFREGLYHFDALKKLKELVAGSPYSPLSLSSRDRGALRRLHSRGVRCRVSVA